MRKWQKIKMILTGKRPLIDIWHYYIGMYRYNLYYAECTFNYKRYTYRNERMRNPFMRKHIDEQITYRVKWMDKECFDNGSCKICGCDTTALQMANKSCDKPCYPSMMNKKQWEAYKRGSIFKDKHGVWMPTFVEGIDIGSPILFKETPHSYVQDNKS